MSLRFSLAVMAAAAGAALVPVPAGIVEEAFSTGAYPRIQRVITPLTNTLPFAVFDVVILVVPIVVLVMLARGIAEARRTRRVGPALRSVAGVGMLASFAYLAFLGLWGLNYRRVPMTERLVLDASPPGPDAVVNLGLRAVERMNALHARAHAQGWGDEEWRDPALRDAFVTVQGWLTDASPAVPGRVKQTLIGPYFRGASVDGMINPFGLEVLGNPDLLPFERPFVAAHEWAHLAGFADESEASFVGWLTCLRAGVPAQYSAWMGVYWQMSAEVGEKDRQRLGDALTDGPRRDLAAVAARVSLGAWPALRTAGWAVYDQYLKANRVEEGIRSYGAVVTLMLRARLDENGVPERRQSLRR